MGKRYQLPSLECDLTLLVVSRQGAGLVHVPVSSSNNREEWRVRQSQRRESKAVWVPSEDNIVDSWTRESKFSASKERIRTEAVA